MAEQSITNHTSHEDRILEAASELFLENGYEVTSTAEIASHARVSKRELYACFRDKRAILTSVIGRLQAETKLTLDVEWSSGEDLRTVLLRAGSQLLRFISSERFGKLFRIVASETFRDPITARDFFSLGPGAGRLATAAYLKRQMAAGNICKCNTLQAADDFLDLLISAQYLTAVVLGQAERPLRIRARVNHAIDVFLSFYAPTPQKTPPAARAKSSISKRSTART